MNKALLNLLKFSLFLGLGLTILYILYYNLNTGYQDYCQQSKIPVEDCSLIDKTVTDFKNANYFWILIVLISYIFSNISRTIRWIMLIKPLGYTPRFVNAFLTIMLGYFANLGLPRIGEIVRASTFGRYEKIPVDKVMGTVVVDRIIDVISLLLVIGLTLILQFDIIWNFMKINLLEKFKNSGSIISHPFVIGFIFFALLSLVLFFLFQKKIKESPLFQKIKKIAAGFSEGIQTISKLEKPGLFILHSINIWFMYFCMTYISFFAFAPTANLSPMAALMVFVFGAFGMVIPSPGGMGTYHALTVFVLTSFYALNQFDAFSFANISFFSIQIGANVLLGIVALLFLPMINKNYSPLTNPVEMKNLKNNPS